MKRRYKQLAGAAGFFVFANGTHGQPAELTSCLEPGTYCVESPLDTVDVFELGCGVTFVQFAGRAAFQPLINRGPVTISVRTLSRQNAPFPLYVELVGRLSSDPPGCTTLLAGNLTLVAQGLPPQCGGVWEAVGPVDLTQVGIPLGSTYHVQLVGFRDVPIGYGSTGFACLRVTSHPTPVARMPWQHAKLLYRDTR